MNPTELAHWRYRVKALEPEVKQWEKWARDTQSDVSRWPTIPIHKRLADEAAAILKANKWLLEEARFMSELGDTNGPEPPPQQRPQLQFDSVLHRKWRGRR